MEAKHTKGTWAYRKTRRTISHKHGETGQSYTIATEEESPKFSGKCIALVEAIDLTETPGFMALNEHKYGNEEAEANAQLIAAAPDMLEALIWAKEQFKILSDKGLYPEHLLTENGGNGIMPIVQAINKATRL